MAGLMETYTALHNTSDHMQPETHKTSPLTPRGPRRLAVVIDSKDSYPSPAHESVMNTPRKKLGKERPGRSATSRASSSPMRCSPSKRHLHVSSSSSPSRESNRREASRPARRRSRTSSVTSILVEGLASVRCQEDRSSDGAIIMTDEALSPMLYDTAELKNVTDKEGTSLFGVSTIQAMKMGFSKYTPLLKVLSEPWKGDNTKTDLSAPIAVATSLKGHRRSVAWENKISPDYHQDAKNEGKPFANRETKTLYLDSLVSKSHAKAEVSRGSRARNRRLDVPSSHQSGALEYLSSRCTSLPRRNNRKAWSPLDVVAVGSKAATQALTPAQPSLRLRSTQEVSAEREKDMMNRQTSLSQEAWQSILKGETNSPPSEEPNAIPPSSMPNIIVTPPVSTDAAQAQSAIPLLTFTDTNMAPKVSETQGEDVVMATLDAGNSDAKKDLTSTADVTNASRLEAAYILRQCEDEQGLALYKATIDKLLSEYFAYRSAKRTWKLARQISDFLLEIIKLKEDVIENENDDKYAPYRQRELPIVSIPSLSSGRCHRIDNSGDSVMLSIERASLNHRSALNIVLEHLVTGLIALVTDNRAPYETPQALGRLCLALQRELPLAISTSPRSRKEKDCGICPSPDSPITSWVQECVTSTQECPESPLCHQSAEISIDKDEMEWVEYLRSSNSSAIFVRYIDTTVNNILERGEEIRLKANLLAVPPPRKGSRKRWMMATAEITQRRVARDKAMNQVTRGVISESEYRKLERQWAVIGNPKDSFAGLTLVRFIGELYVSQLLDIHAIRKWLYRFFINTVFPNIPSSYELEAGCALLITVGEALDYEAGNTSRYQDDSSPFSSPEQQTTTATKACRFADQIEIEEDNGIVKSGTQVEDAYADDWTFIKSRTSKELLDKTGSNLVTSTAVKAKEMDEEMVAQDGKKQVALDTITNIMKRLEEIIELEEIDNESRAWTREIIALRKRNWQQGHGKESYYHST